MAEDIVDSLRKEISETQKRREKLNTLKLAFVTGLLGFGGVKLGEGGAGTSTYQLLYLAPLVGLFFDLLILGEHFSIRRIGKFFKTKCDDEGEREWQEFVSDKKNRDKFFRYGSYGFTILTFFAAILLFQKSHPLTPQDVAWFSLVFVAFVIVAWRGQEALKKCDATTEERDACISALVSKVELCITTLKSLEHRLGTLESKVFNQQPSVPTPPSAKVP